MKSYPVIANFDGAKFAARYGLDSFRGDFFVSKGQLFVPDKLPDDPPIQEPCDPVVVKPTIEERLAKLESAVTTLKDAKIGVK